MRRTIAEEARLSSHCPAPPLRLRSLDALRGFDMIWIIGGDSIAAEIGRRSGRSSVIAVTDQLSHHVQWAGFRFYDLIFPLFVFMIGAAIPFSIGGRVEQGDPKRDIIRKILGNVYLAKQRTVLP